MLFLIYGICIVLMLLFNFVFFKHNSIIEILYLITMIPIFVGLSLLFVVGVLIVKLVELFERKVRGCDLDKDNHI